MTVLHILLIFCMFNEAFISKYILSLILSLLPQPIDDSSIALEMMYHKMHFIISMSATSYSQTERNEKIVHLSPILLRFVVIRNILRKYREILSKTIWAERNFRKNRRLTVI